MDKGLQPPLLKKGEIGIAKNYGGITLTSVAAKIYNALLRNCIEPKIEKILTKNQNIFRRNQSMTLQTMTIRQILIGVCPKNLEATLLFVDFSKVFGSILREDGENTSHQRPPCKTIVAIMMLYKNTKVNVCLTDGHTDYFNIVVGVLQGDILASHQFIICQDYVLRTSIDLMKENGFKLAQERSRRYTAHKLLRTQTTPMI